MYKGLQVQSNVTKPKFTLIILFQVYFKNHKWGFVIQSWNILRNFRIWQAIPDFVFQIQSFLFFRLPRLHSKCTILDNYYIFFDKIFPKTVHKI